MGFGSAAPRMTIPYSVSMPSTLTMATGGRYPPARCSRVSPALTTKIKFRLRRRSLEVLTGGNPLDRAAPGGLVALGHDGADVDDPLALLPGDLGPVVGVSGVGQVLVLLVLLLDGIEEVLSADASPFASDHPLDCQLL